MSSHQSRHGLTLIEVVVVVFILIMLWALLTPAITPSREAARRAECKNNLKQIGLALHTYHDAHRRFPPGMLQNDSTWSIHILPYLEERNLYECFNFDAASITAANASQAPLNREMAAATAINTYVCPQDGHGEMVESVARSNYVGNFGADAPIGLSTRATNHGGVFGFGSALRMKDITDGTSNTVFVGERLTEGTRPAHDNMAVWSSPAFYGLDRAVLTWGWGSDPINSRKAGSFSSAHEGGAQFCLGDGSVRFLSEAIDSKPTGVDSTQGTCQNLLDRADGQKIGDT